MLCSSPAGLQELEETVGTGATLNSVMGTRVAVVPEACAEVFASFTVSKCTNITEVIFE